MNKEKKQINKIDKKCTTNNPNSESKDRNFFAAQKKKGIVMGKDYKKFVNKF